MNDELVTGDWSQSTSIRELYFELSFYATTMIVSASRISASARQNL